VTGLLQVRSKMKRKSTVLWSAKRAKYIYPGLRVWWKTTKKWRSYVQAKKQSHKQKTGKKSNSDEAEKAKLYIEILEGVYLLIKEVLHLCGIDL